MAKPATKSIAASSIKSLGGAAPTFELPVTIARRDGTNAVITLQAKGMRKSEWAALRDEHLKVLRETDKPMEVDFSFAALVGERAKEALSVVLKGAAGWDLDDDFTTENLAELEDVIPGSVQAMLVALDSALFHGRLGN